MSLEKLPHSVIKKMMFREYTVPEMLPMLSLTIGIRAYKNIGMRQIHLFLLIIVYALEQMYGSAANAKIRDISKIKKQNLQYYLEFLTRHDYVKRTEIGNRLTFKVTRKGISAFAVYQKKYREEILRLREYGIKFEDL